MLTIRASACFLVLIFASGACVSFQDPDAVKPPTISQDMPLEQAFQHAIDFGGPTLEEVKSHVKARQAWPALNQLSAQYIQQNLGQVPPAKILHAIHLYRLSAPQIQPRILEALMATEEPVYRKMAWQLAAIKPSADVARYLDDKLSQLVVAGRQDEHLIPEMARAVRANEIKSVYSLLRRGLMTNGSDEFAKAMIALKADDQLADDLMNYLAQANLEDLRQINQSSVNMYTCLVILRYFMGNPLPVTNPNIGHVYLYAISRNPALAEMARDVLDQQIANYKEQMVYALSQQPMKVQMAFVEGTRHYPSANVKLMLAGLRKMTAYEEVEQEIESLRRF